MDPDELVVEQIGLLLTQVRYSRIALEHIERATTRYAGIALNIPGGAAALGAPPMIDGALKVYVVNINDLTAGPGIGDMLAGVIGGAGRFLGGFFSGLVGGTVSSVLFPWMFLELRRIVESIERIVNRLGLDVPKDTGKEPDSGGPSLMVQLHSLAEVLREVASLFRAASTGGPAAAAPPTAGPVHTYLDLVRGITNVIDGLILLVPLLTGALASFLLRLQDIQFAIVDMLQFGLRNVLLLRAAVIAIVLDTLSLAGRLAASVVGIVAAAVDTVLESVFRVIHAGLTGVLAVVRIVSTGVKNTIDALMIFLRDGVGSLLVFLGGLRVFQLAFHLAQILPAILPGIAKVLDKPLSDEESKALGAAAKLVPAAPTAGIPATPTIAPFPDLADKLLPAGAEAAIVGRVDSMGKTIRTEAGTSFGAVQGAMEGIGKRMQDTIGTLDKGLDRTLTDRLATAKGHAQQLADSLKVAEDASKQRPATGLEVIAKAYESWLTGGGLRTLMGELDAHFRATPAASGAGSVAGQVVSGVAESGATRSVVVEIGEVTIDLGDGAPQTAPEAAAPASGFDADAYAEWQQNREDRLGIVLVPAIGYVG